VPILSDVSEETIVPSTLVTSRYTSLSEDCNEIEEPTTYIPDVVIGFVLLQTSILPLHLYVKLQKKERKEATESGEWGGTLTWSGPEISYNKQSKRHTRRRDLESLLR
jgi:hypothetical protein